ncbi:MAG: tetratricopeptide repeat protein [Bdellovibrio sp.]|nr:tetratricopeptide repeat protein [Bdellovibrio sp.]
MNSSIVEKNWKIVAGLLVVLIVGGAIASGISISNTNKEQKAQESYFLAEKSYLELKNKKAVPETGAKKEEASVNYTAAKAGFEKVIQDYPKSKAAQMSALYLSDILVTEKNPELALTTLQKVENNDSGLVNTLVQQQIGHMQADKNLCPDAVQTWQKIVNRKEASFLHNEVKVQQALCYQKMNDNKKAEEILTNLANQKQDHALEASSTSKEAEKYLRLIQFKKASGT